MDLKGFGLKINSNKAKVLRLTVIALLSSALLDRISKTFITLTILVALFLSKAAPSLMLSDPLTALNPPPLFCPKSGNADASTSTSRFFYLMGVTLAEWSPLFFKSSKPSLTPGTDRRVEMPVDRSHFKKGQQWSYSYSRGGVKTYRMIWRDLKRILCELPMILRRCD